MRLAAFDLSLTAIGWARNVVPAPALGGFWESGVLRPKWRGAKRLWWCLHHVMDTARECEAVIIEGYAHHAKYQTHQMGELGGVIRLGMFQANTPLIIVPPTKLKKFATGKGSGKKEAPLAECIRRLGYEGSSHDEADALWLLQMGLHHYRLPGAVSLPKINLTALYDDVEWPTLREMEF